MICRVIKPWTSKVDGRLRMPGQVVDVDEKRAAELAAVGVVEAPTTAAPARGTRKTSSKKATTRKK
jgi:hypothetical protein